MHAGAHLFNWGLFSCVSSALLKGMGFNDQGPGKGGMLTPAKPRSPNP